MTRIHHDRTIAPPAPGRFGAGRARARCVCLRRRFVRRLYLDSGDALVGDHRRWPCLALWWRLSSGPIELDMATPWLKAAIEDNFGGKHTVVVGGTQIERDEKGRTSLRLRDIVVRDADGTVVASAPKAEVGISGIGLLTGHRARAEPQSGRRRNGGPYRDRRPRHRLCRRRQAADRHRLAAVAAAVPAHAADSGTPQDARCAQTSRMSPALLAWIDGVGATGLDGHDLRELGLKNGNLVVDDQRNGKHWNFDRINASLTRPAAGRRDLPARVRQSRAALGAERGDASARRRHPRGRHRSAQRLAPATSCWRCASTNAGFDADLPLSASIRADITADGTPQVDSGPIDGRCRHYRRSRRPTGAASPSTTPISASTGTRGGAPWSCRSRSSRAATSSPCAPRWSARRRPERLGI